MSARIKISLKDPEIRAVWETVLEARREVASWPAWMRGDYVISDEELIAPVDDEAPETTSEGSRVEPPAGDPRSET
jgi:hypothetical protein